MAIDSCRVDQVLVGCEFVVNGVCDGLEWGYS